MFAWEISETVGRREFSRGPRTPASSRPAGRSKGSRCGAAPEGRTRKRSPVDEKAQKLRFEGKTYRYQRVDSGEALRLLANPLGSIPIHRRQPPSSDDTLRKTLIRDLTQTSSLAEPRSKE